MQINFEEFDITRFEASSFCPIFTPLVIFEAKPNWMIGFVSQSNAAIEGLMLCVSSEWFTYSITSNDRKKKKGLNPVKMVDVSKTLILKLKFSWRDNLESLLIDFLEIFWSGFQLRPRSSDPSFSGSIFGFFPFSRSSVKEEIFEIDDQNRSENILSIGDIQRSLRGVTTRFLQPRFFY